MASELRMSFVCVILITCFVPISASLPQLSGFTNSAAVSNMIAQSLNKALHALSINKQLEQQYLHPGIGVPPQKRFSHALHKADPSSIAQLSDRSFISVEATKELVRLSNTPLHLLQSNPNVINEWRRQFSSHCNTPLLRCNPHLKYRTTEGTCNNLQNPTWGSAMRGYIRYLPAAYDDGVDSPRQLGVTGRPLPSPRVVSNVIHSTGRSDPEEGGRSVMFMSWGAFAVLDLARTPFVRGPDNTDISCCPSGNSPAAQVAACFPIRIPRDDPRFTSNCMNFVRSVTAPRRSCDMGVREQLNEQTSFMDGSMVYGFTQEAMNRLRAGRGGLMNITMNGLLPAAPEPQCILSNPGEYCFDAGAPRNTVVPSFAAVFTLWVREHNRIATQLRQFNPHWSDEKLFQETRKISIAMIQHINYNEYLPHVLSNTHMRRYGLFSAPNGHQNVYNPNVNPTIANVVPAVALRFAHTHVPDYQGLSNLKTPKSFVTPIEFTFNRPALIFTDNGRGVDKMNLWQLQSKLAKSDRFLQNGIRNALFLNDMGGALDLAAINIQRGREHGIASYNAWRQWCGLQPAYHFGTGPGGLIDLDPLAAILLSRVYRHPNDMDLFTAALSETNIRGTLTGPTFACILSKQFESLKKGDRFWYENDNPVTGFTKAQLNAIKTVRLSQVLCANSVIRKIQPRALLVPSQNNQMVGCKLMPTIDLRPWIERPNREYKRHPISAGFRLHGPVVVPNNPVRLWALPAMINNVNGVLPTINQRISL